MPFLLYEKTPLEGSAFEYHSPLRIVLGGGGLIWLSWKQFLRDSDCGWEVSVENMLKAGGYGPDRALVIDTAPRRSTVSLFDMRSVRGYSYAYWTPIMLTLEQLFVDADVTVPVDDFKHRFSDTDCERCTVRTILYLKGGYRGGDWNWGGNSRTTAALLWEEAWSFFTSEGAKFG